MSRAKSEDHFAHTRHSLFKIRSKSVTVERVIEAVAAGDQAGVSAAMPGRSEAVTASDPDGEPGR